MSYPGKRKRRACRLDVTAALAALALVLPACASGGSDPSPGNAACPALPPGVSGSPMTIADAVGMANALVEQSAAPLTIPCLLSRLDRPLTLLGCDSEFSLQPSDGRRSPRMFAIFGPTKLVMSVSPGGAAQDRIELAEYPTTPLRSIKAEMAFPMTAPVPLAEPYDRIRNGNGTVCGGCHHDEAPAPEVTVTNAFESGVFKPRPEDIVPLPEIEEQRRTCDPKQEPYRCAMFDALLDHGAIAPGALPADAPTIFD
jgi:hypothetical protein